MKLLIGADMEGITGVVDWSHVREGTEAYERFRRSMTEDVNAAIRGAFAAGVADVVVSDGHGAKTNLLVEGLDPRARLNSGTGPLAMVEGIDNRVTAVFFVGYHARAGTPAAVLSHTVSSSSVANVWLNDRLVGEIGINAAVCGHFGASVLLVTGDAAACQEARTELPGVRTFATKRASGHGAAECLPPEITHGGIEQAAREAIEAAQSGGTGMPVRLVQPVRCVVEFLRPSMADSAARLPGARQIDACRIEIEAENAALAYQYFRSAVKLAGQ